MKISSARPSVSAVVVSKFLPSNAVWPVRFGWIEVIGLPALLPAVTAAISRSGCPASRRRSSPPA